MKYAFHCSGLLGIRFKEITDLKRGVGGGGIDQSLLMCVHCISSVSVGTLFYPGFDAVQDRGTVSPHCSLCA